MPAHYPAGLLAIALSDTQQTAAQLMMIVVMAGLVALLALDYLAQRRAAKSTGMVSPKAWLGGQLHKTFRTGLIAIIAYFELLCGWLLFSSALSSGPKSKVDPFSVMETDPQTRSPRECRSARLRDHRSSRETGN